MQVDRIVQVDPEFRARIVVEIDLDHRVAVDFRQPYLPGVGERAMADELEPLVAGRSGSPSSRRRSIRSPWPMREIKDLVVIARLAVAPP